jgi:hypothetical protein
MPGRGQAIIESNDAVDVGQATTGLTHQTHPLTHPIPTFDVENRS